MKTNSAFDRREFLRTTAMTAASLALSAIPGAAAAAEAAAGVPARRLEKLATGANVCRWFRYPRRETDEFFAHYIPPSEAEFMAGLGLRHVRLCVAPKVIMDPAAGAVREDRARFLEEAIRRFQQAGLLVMVDIHNEDRAAELDPAWQDAFVKFWTALASRLATFDPDLTLLEIVNEPVFDKRESEWDTLNERLAGAIRRSAPEHTIVTSGPNWGGIDGLRKLKPLGDQNVVYSFHCYDPFPFTHQGATWSSDAVKPLRGVPYPSSPEAVAPLLPALEAHPASKAMLEKYGRDQWNREKIADRFRLAQDWGTRHGVPLYCGEFGVFPSFAKPEHRANWFQDFGQVLAEKKIGWAVWGWDEGFGLNRRINDGRPMIDPVVAKALGLSAPTGA